MGKYLRKKEKQERTVPFWMIGASFLPIEIFAFFVLAMDGEGFSWQQLWPLAFGLLWAGLAGNLLRLLPEKAARIGYGIAYFLCLL